MSPASPKPPESGKHEGFLKSAPRYLSVVLIALLPPTLAWLLWVIPRVWGKLKRVWVKLKADGVDFPSWVDWLEWLEVPGWARIPTGSSLWVATTLGSLAVLSFFLEGRAGWLKTIRIVLFIELFVAIACTIWVLDDMGSYWNPALYMVVLGLTFWAANLILIGRYPETEGDNAISELERWLKWSLGVFVILFLILLGALAASADDNSAKRVIKMTIAMFTLMSILAASIFGFKPLAKTMLAGSEPSTATTEEAAAPGVDGEAEGGPPPADSGVGSEDSKPSSKPDDPAEPGRGAAGGGGPK